MPAGGAQRIRRRDLGDLQTAGQARPGRRTADDEWRGLSTGATSWKAVQVQTVEGLTEARRRHRRRAGAIRFHAGGST